MMHALEEICITRAASEFGSSSDADPVTTEVLRHSLNSAAEQMKVALCRTAVSPTIYEMNDFACALFDDKRRLLAQAQAFPLFIGAMESCVAEAVTAVGGEEALERGDVLLSTLPYSTGSHQEDIVLIAPAFSGERVVGYSVVKAAVADLGAQAPYCTDTTDVFQEGVIFPGIKLYRRGELAGDMYRTILANSRHPRALEGDLKAAIGATQVGVAGLMRQRGRFSPREFGGAIEQMFNHAEAAVRSLIEQIPDGKFSAEGTLDSNGVDDEIVPFSIDVEVHGGCISIDFTNAPPIQRGPINCPLPSTVSGARLAVLSLLGGNELINEGHLRPIEVRTRPGTMFHPVAPAPVFLYAWPAIVAVDVIQRALFDAIPAMIPAGNGASGGSAWWGTASNSEFWVTGMCHFAGRGATTGRDGGPPLMHIACSGLRNTPAEVIERELPMIVRKFELAPDSCGAGQWRGGLGVDIRYEVTNDSYFTANFERCRSKPWGLRGGSAGRPNRVTVHREAGPAIYVGKATGVPLPKGALVEIRTGGGGGVGDPRKRGRDAVLEDVREGYLSEVMARRNYRHAFEEALA